MAGFRQPSLEFRPLIAAVGAKLVRERIQAEPRAHQQQAAIPVDIGGMDDRVQDQPGGVYQELALLFLSSLPGIVAWRVDADHELILLSEMARRSSTAFSTEIVSFAAAMNSRTATSPGGYRNTTGWVTIYAGEVTSSTGPLTGGRSF